MIPAIALKETPLRKCFEIQRGAAFPSRQRGLRFASPHHEFQNSL
jgi:hypothetical protein